MELNTDLPFVVTLDDTDDPCDALDAIALGSFVAGREPHANTVRLTRVDPTASLLPPGVRPAWTAVRDRVSSTVARGDGWTLRSVRWQDGSGEVRVTAVSPELAAEVVTAATLGAELPPPVDDDTVTFRFWYGRQWFDRDVAVRRWADICMNYNQSARAALDQVTALRRDSLNGRLLLLYGPPGTGKTSALRAIGHAWRDWCSVHVVTDPDNLFRNPGYLMEVTLPDEHDPKRAHLIVLEDCDEVIGEHGSGQAMARLLNLTDGIVGQARDTIFAITTNEPLTALHPAVTRPGRCLAEISVGPLSQREALAWLGSTSGVGPGGATLAELYERRGAIHTIRGGRPANPGAGVYL